MSRDYSATAPEDKPLADIRVSRASLDRLMGVLIDLMASQQRLRQEHQDPGRLKRAIDRQDGHIHRLKEEPKGEIESLICCSSFSSLEPSDSEGLSPISP